MSAIENVSRRGFMKGMVSAGALVLSVRFLPETLWAEGLPKDTKVDHAVLNPSVYLGINTDGTVFIIAHRSEMGTGPMNSKPIGSA
jgi:isoquinoline 1-oxidoreductase beta subunit